ncbi:MAG: dodecin family protein [Dehalococcoidia bacterium]|nr:dodecin family protein [Dehalococcoidia bacterium]
MTVEQTKKIVDVVGVSDESIANAVTNAVTRASQTLRGLEWFEVNDIRGRIEGGKPLFQVTVRIGFQIENQNL